MQSYWEEKKMLYDVARRFGGAVDKPVCYERKSGPRQAPRENMVECRLIY